MQLTKPQKVQVFYVFHTFEQGHEISLFKTKSSATTYIEKLVHDYVVEYTEDCGEKLVGITASDIPELTDGRCNIEIGFETVLD